jgi:hypothetical protein
MRLTCPSTLPELHRRVSPAVTASWSARAGDEGLQRGLAAGGGHGHLLLEVAAAAPGHQAGEPADVLGEGG